MEFETDPVITWHAGLDPGDAAQLRRCEAPIDALVQPSCLALMRRVQWGGGQDRLASLAMILAHVKQNTNRPIMRACGRERWGDEGSLLSSNRFNRIITTDEFEGLTQQLVRLVHLLDGVVRVDELAEAVRYWPSDQVRRRWAADFYAYRPPSDESSP